MGNIFFRGGSPSEIETMGYRSLKYWSGWHDIYNAAEKSVTEKNGNA